MTPIPVVRYVRDALGRTTQTTPIMIDDANLATYEMYGWRTIFGAPVLAPSVDQIPEIVLSPTDLRPWQVQWAAWLNGASIATSLWLPNAAGLTLSNQSTSSNTAITWIGPAVPGTYLLTNRITASDGREDDQSVTVVVQQR